jgi:hypothetical protein
MAQPVIERILRESGMDGLLELLAQRLSPSDLQSLLLEVYRRRAAQVTPAHLLDRYANNRFARPAAAGPVALAALDRLAFECAAASFEAIELSPLTPLGTVSALAPVDQNSVVATIGNTEVVSDSTNVMALECAVRRRELRKLATSAGEAVRLCASQRLVRAQNFNRPGLLAHFRIFAICTAGRAAPGYRFELEALETQLACYLDFLARVGEIGCRVGSIRVAFTDLQDRAFLERLRAVAIPRLVARFPGAKFECDPDTVTAPAYYQLARYRIYAATPERGELDLADGGFTDWTQKLLGDRKERLLISGIATERVGSLRL